ncbi:MAG TPA: tRNA (adenosine(37)-N6)-threonylcarbamoyltransferase complex dimerization subunit type 1 TsaB, partial [Cellvibrio sp.]|nr:tRNA (adenosine(37)-N6)-threonylcarbamoyltransferase complex dimerization subunit type 1 TsaB [Cellvibrio sp.]
ARMDEVYWGLFSRAGDSVKALTDEFVMKPELVSQQDSVQSNKGKLLAVGSGCHYPEMQVMAASAVVLDVHPKAEDIALIAAQVWSVGGAIDILTAEPVYLRDTISWQKRQRIRNSN